VGRVRTIRGLCYVKVLGLAFNYLQHSGNAQEVRVYLQSAIDVFVVDSAIDLRTGGFNNTRRPAG